MPRLVIIGNGIVQKNRFMRRFGIPTKFSRWIDSSEKVIRFNEMKNLSRGTGNKTDILVLINRGKPAVKFCERLLLPRKVVSKISELWFSRPLNTERLKLPDRSEDILSFQNLNKDISIKSPELMEYFELQDHLVDEPSSGLVAISMILNDNRFKNWDIHLLGFGWEGWHGHDWEKEKAYCLQLIEQGRIKLKKN